MKKSGIGILLAFLVLAGCSPVRPVASAERRPANDDRIVFQDFFASREGDKTTIREGNPVFRDGRIREGDPDSSAFLHPVGVYFENDRGKVLKSTVIEHPLIGEFEFAADDGSLSRITTYRDSASFILRYNAINELAYIEFKSIREDTLPIDIRLKLKK